MSQVSVSVPTFRVSGLGSHLWAGSLVSGLIFRVSGSRVLGLTHKMGPGSRVLGPTKCLGSSVPLFGYAFFIERLVATSTCIRLRLERNVFL